MLFNRHTILTGLLALSTATSAYAQESINTKVDNALRVVNQLCLSGTEYSIGADAKGNITIKKGSPKGEGRVTLNARESVGATAFQDNLRMIGDDKIRECTQQHIGRVLDAILETVPQEDSGFVYGEELAAHSTFESAKYLGILPGAFKAYATLDGADERYYRVYVKKPSNISIDVSKNSNDIFFYLYSSGKKFIDDSTQSLQEFVMPGDYFIKLKLRRDNESSAFKLTVSAQEDNS